jgi:hypothetical protein
MNENVERLLGLGRSPRIHMWALASAFGCAVLVLAFCAYWFRFDLNNIDGISYISIATQYANGQADTALNAYWSPMVSWLMVPFLMSGMSGIFAFMVVNAISAACGIAIGSIFIWRRTGHKVIPTLLFIVISTAFFAGTTFVLTPDSLVVTWMILFLVALTWADGVIDMADSGRRKLWLAGATLGAVGALGYFVKQFLIPVYVVSLVIWIAIRLWPRQRAAGAVSSRPTLTAVTALAVVVAVVCGPWAIALSVKYGEPTIGTSFAVNMESKFAPPAGNAAGAPVNIVTPPNENAVSAGEDRTFLTAAARAAQADETTNVSVETSGVEAEPVAAPSTVSKAKYYIKERIVAFPLYVNKIGAIAPYALLILAGFGLALVFGFASYRRNRAVALAGILATVYFLGFAAITSSSSGGGNSRYYWPVFILSSMMALLLLPEVWQRVKAGGGKPVRLIAVVLLFSLLPVSAVMQHGIGKAAPFSSGSGSPGLPKRIADGDAKTAEQVFVDAQLAGVIPADSDIMGSNYRTTLKLGYLLGAHVYGKSNMAYNPADPAFLSALQQNGIDYYVDFGPVSAAALADVSGIGTLVDSSTQVLPCADDKGATRERCLVRVVEVTPAG